MQKTKGNPISLKKLYFLKSAFLFAHIGVIAANSTLYWFDDFYAVSAEGDLTAYNCNNSACIKYTCSQSPSVPYCDQCTKISSTDAYSSTPINCDNDQACMSCLDNCNDWATDWTDILPVPGASGEGYNYVESHVCTAGTSIGNECSGVCDPSWHANCVLTVTDDSNCNCQSGAYVCVGEEIDISLACNPSFCDPFNDLFDASKCACTTGVCQFIPGLSVRRKIGAAIVQTRCQGYNNVLAELSCSDPRCTQTRTYQACPSCITGLGTTALAECSQICLLDSQCVAFTFEDHSSKNLSSNCYKSVDCIQQTSPSSTISVYPKDTSWLFPKECLPRLQLTEDYHQNPRVGFTHLDSSCHSATVSVILNVKYGQLNFQLPDFSFDCVDPGYDPTVEGNPARTGLCKTVAGGFKALYTQACPTWPAGTSGRGCGGLDGSVLSADASGAKISLLPSVTQRSQVTFPGAKLTGPYAAVRAAMRNLTYLPPNDQNTNRLRSRIYSVESSRSLEWPLSKPYEEMTVTVKFSDEHAYCNPNGKTFPTAQVNVK